MNKVRAGEKLSIAANDWNKLVDLANARTMGGDGSPIPNSSPVKIQVRNDTGADLPRRSVVGLGDSAISLASYPTDWKAGIAISGVEPAAEHVGGKYAVLVDSITDGQYGEAVVAGVIQVLLDVVNEDHEYADVTAGEVDKLQTAATGSARIIWKESGTGDKLAIVQLLGTAPTGVLFRNDSGYTVPPHGVMQVYRIQGPTGLVEIIRPDGTFGNNHLFLVNGPTEVLDGEESRGTWLTDAAGKVLTKASLSTTADRFFAPKANYWHLEQNSDTGYEAMGFICFNRGTLSTEPSYSYDYGSGATTATYYHCIQQVEHPELSLDGGGSALLMYDSSGSTVTTLDCTVPRLQAYIGGIMQSQISYRAGIDMTNADPYDNGTFQIVRDGYYQLDFQLRGHFTSSGAYEYDETYDVSPSGTVTVTHPRGDTSYCVSLEMEICIDDVGNTPSSWTTIYKENMSPFSIIDRHIQYYFFGANGKKVVLRLTLADTYNQAKFYMYQASSPVSDQYSRYKVTRLRNSAFIG